MCGIAGLASATPSTQSHLGTVRAMNEFLTHRGPDGSGEFNSPHVLLAMRRLSIIDLTGGWQPLYNEDRSLALIANGEVYNHVELRAKLEAGGHRFNTHSDCENILHLYEEYGADLVHHLRGMYAFALWDQRRRRLILGRDRMGEKPLYLYEEDGKIWFASELRALIAGGRVPFRLDPAAVSLYYHYGYVPEPTTAVVGVRKLPRGNILIIDIDPWKVEQREYWRMEDAPAISGDPVKLVREELETIGELTIRSDVPVGVALSSGLDSSLIAAMAARHSPGKIHAITVGYRGRPRQDERAEAKQLADHLKMPFHEVEISPDEVVDLFPDRAIWRDDPIADPAAHGYWTVARESHNLGIPVLLQGQGGDELFWGYPWVREMMHAAIVKDGQNPDRLESFLKTIRRCFPRNFSRSALRDYAMLLGGLGLGWRQANPDRGTPRDQLPFYNLSEGYQIGEFALPKLLTPQFLARARECNPAEIFTIPRPWGDLGALITRLICDTYLLENGMAQGDRLSMNSSVELRLPLCDYRLAEIVIGLRKTYPDHDLPPKTWLKAAAADLLPDWVMSRPKRGFTPPSREWMPHILARYGARLESGYLVANRVITPDAARRMNRTHSRFSAWDNIFFRSLVLEHWCEGMEALSSKAASRTPSGMASVA